MTENKMTLLTKVRTNVCLKRELKLKEIVENRIQWSLTSSKKNWFLRFLFDLPSKQFTEEEALISLKKLVFPGIYSVFYCCNTLGADASQIFNAIEFSIKTDLKYSLSTQEVIILKKWET